MTYNWKEKEITATEANNNNGLNGWKIENGEKVTAVKPEAPTNVAANRPEGFDPKPSKVYDLNGKTPRRFHRLTHDRNKIWYYTYVREQY